MLFRSAEATRFDHPADAVLSRFFREHPRMGGRDRSFVAETVFAALRHLLLLRHLAGGNDARAALLLSLTRFQGVSLRELGAVLREGEPERLAAARDIRVEELPVALQADLPQWVVDRLARRAPDAEIIALGRAMQVPAPLDLRVNTLRTSREEALKAFAADGIEASPTQIGRAHV